VLDTLMRGNTLPDRGGKLAAPSRASEGGYVSYARAISMLSGGAARPRNAIRLIP